MIYKIAPVSMHPILSRPIFICFLQHSILKKIINVVATLWHIGFKMSINILHILIHLHPMLTITLIKDKKMHNLHFCNALILIVNQRTLSCALYCVCICVRYVFAQSLYIITVFLFFFFQSARFPKTTNFLTFPFNSTWRFS